VACHGVVKRFGRVTALDRLELAVGPGEVHGFLGPNGAGKSTTIRLLLGLMRADAGELRLFGRDPWAAAVTLHRRLAYVPGDVTLWPTLTGGQAIDALLGLRGIRHAPRRAELIDRFGFDPTRYCRTYSKGNRQKVALIAAFAADVDLLVLDEPTSGLDPLMEAVFQGCVAEAAAQGTTVLLSSHILAEVEQLADRLTIIRAGRAVQTGTLADLRHLRRRHVTAVTARPVADRLRALAGVADVTGDGAGVEFAVAPERLGAALGLLQEAGVTDLTCAPPTLETIFLRHYETAPEMAVAA
jgi:ABC-2 type transport system ATP-binding protein